MNSKQKGDITELAVMLYITKLGYQVSIPFGDKERYDQIWDINGKLLRIQVKTSRPINNKHDGIRFSCRSNTKVDGKIKHSNYNKDEIDYFCTFWDGKCYIVPVEECKTDKTLRFTIPKNKQLIDINFAKDYEVEEVLKKINQI